MHDEEMLRQEIEMLRDMGGRFGAMLRREKERKKSRRAAQAAEGGGRAQER